MQGWIKIHRRYLAIKTHFGRFGFFCVRHLPLATLHSALCTLRFLK